MVDDVEFPRVRNIFDIIDMQGNGKDIAEIGIPFPCISNHLRVPER